MLYTKSLFLITLYLASNCFDVGSAAAAAAASTTAAKRRPSQFLRPWGVPSTSSSNKRRNMSDTSDSVAPSVVDATLQLADQRPPHQRPRRIVVMGGPASGKGTQCEYIVRQYNLVHLSTGDMLRAAVARDTSPGSTGALAKQYMDRGELVPDDIIVRLVKERISQRDCLERGYLLDGFPRTRAQAMELKKLGVEPDTFLFIDVPDDVLIQRVIGRRLDPVSGRIYHLQYSPPSDDIMHRVITRNDDTEEKARSRLKQFHANVNAVKSCFQDIMVIVDGSRKPDEVAQSVSRVLEKNTWSQRAASA
mmetsp:Transcript_22345/g.49765  ORF Transcript_22345/g.49765 Transcript_22345/m.49765 type:complete len:306 (-) Transcript_22345:1077-1994(-)|eukprot:CAMPEP_0178605158 /NCGR_PEP_ID=MMETSP0697-20121206/36421_1 /TAXON_ID=265572 /ORGANISM="Extubocellulus spinifer, Strain CCMP396" /LENGTH=305 /DNA_ID=CAMNT_0020243563 /DNA_START=1 /DNA_END=918 /DNA_ORIENTATION=-